ncbi:MAG: haloalkane dehalogenase [Bermanella sp.]|jgi:haloalkane dehalogenase
MTSSIRKSYIDLDDGQMHYRSAGRPELPLLIMLHQSPSSSIMFEALMTELHQYFYILAPDTPGFGMSDPLTGPVTVKAYAAAINAFMRALNVSHAAVFGHHTGAAIAVQLACDFPTQVNSLALSGPTLLSDALKTALPEKAKAFAETEDGSHLLAMWQRMRAKEPNAPLALCLRETLLGLAVGAAYPDAYGAVIEQDFESKLRALELPTLVFSGDGDPLYSQLDAALAACKQGRKAVLPGARTYSCDLFASEIADLLLRFFLEQGDMESDS